jgi:hypothetical protein
MKVDTFQKVRLLGVGGFEVVIEVCQQGELNVLHNLTEHQLKILRWIVKQVKDGELKETFEVAHISTMKETTLFFPELRGKNIPDYIDLGALNALVIEDVLRGSFVTRDTNNYTLTRRAYEISDFDFSNPNPDPIRDYVKEAYRIMESRFSNPELKTLCFQLDINPDRVFATDDLDWPRQLLLYLYRRNRVGDLGHAISEFRPDIMDWPSFPED